MLFHSISHRKITSASTSVSYSLEFRISRKLVCFKSNLFQIFPQCVIHVWERSSDDWIISHFPPIQNKINKSAIVNIYSFFKNILRPHNHFLATYAYISIIDKYKCKIVWIHCYKIKLTSQMRMTISYFTFTRVD
ncbi:hypothetical protein C1646_683839 [Rhizophagus diaphanus]|nr:hypothetical protein C1646_683839 [Rhizophagus diaphanus] [Rhizophagus sp. MUCL 43196]